MDINKLFAEAHNIVPFKRLLPFFIVLIIIGGILVISKIMNSKMPNHDFYNIELCGRVYEIENRPRDTYFLIGSNWYLIKNENIDIISKGDSINKPQESYMLKVFDKESRVKWQGEVKSLIFRQVDSPD